MVNRFRVLSKFVGVLVVSFFLLACGSSGNNLEKLHGKWSVDKKETVDLSPEYGKMSKEIKSELTSRMVRPSLIFDVLGKTVEIYYTENQKNGFTLPFEVKKDKSNIIVITLNRGSPVEITFDSERKIIMRSKVFLQQTGFAEIALTKEK